MQFVWDQVDLICLNYSIVKPWSVFKSPRGCANELIWRTQKSFGVNSGIPGG